MLLVAMMAVGAPLTVQADEQKEAAALAILQTAKKHYKEKNFVKAAQIFATAYEVSGNPAYLFNAGRAYQRGYKLSEAEKHFKLCLKMVKDKSTPMVRRANVHLQEIQEARSAIAAAVKTASGSSLVSPPGKQPVAQPQPRPAPENEPTNKPIVRPAEAKQGKPDAGAGGTQSVTSVAAAEPAWKNYTAWGLIGGGGVIGAVAAWMMATATSNKDALNQEVKDNTKDGKVVMSRAGYDEKVSSINGKIYTGYGLFAAGVTLAATGAWMMSGTKKDAPRVAIMPTPSGVRFGLAARF